MPRYCHKQWKLFGLQNSELICLVVLWLSTHDLEEPPAAVFRTAQFSKYRLLPTTWHHILEEHNLNTHCFEYLNSRTVESVIC